MSKLEKVMGYQNPSVVKRYASENGLSIEEAEIHFEECKKFLYLCSITDRSLSPSKVLDEIWHTFILFTKDYANFCSQYLGSFVHHFPDVEQTPKSKQTNRDAFLYARTLAETTFGSVYEPVWRITSNKVLTGDCSDSPNCGGCSDLGGNYHGCKD
ncbi:MAG TPA: hypothetical protein PKD96_03200 [Candidatus Absconditabacterales bacterium]|nr:hypothetical protein [Candidatus Absconditabacterales bacterium]